MPESFKFGSFQIVNVWHAGAKHSLLQGSTEADHEVGREQERSD